MVKENKNKMMIIDEEKKKLTTISPSKNHPTQPQKVLTLIQLQL